MSRPVAEVRISLLMRVGASQTNGGSGADGGAARRRPLRANIV